MTVDIGNWHLRDYMCLLRSCVKENSDKLLVDTNLFRELRLWFLKRELYQVQSQFKSVRISKTFAAQVIWKHWLIYKKRREVNKRASAKSSRRIKSLSGVYRHNECAIIYVFMHNGANNKF